MPDVRVLNELQIKKNGVVATYKLGTVNGYYNSTDGKFYEEVTHVTEIEGAPNLVYADIAGNALYIYKTATSSFVKVSGEGGSSADNLKFGYLKKANGKFYEDSSYTVEIPGDDENLFITLDTNFIYRYDTTNTEFIQIGGGSGAETIKYVNALPTTDIEDIIYGIVSRISYSETVADNFLDTNNLFEKTEEGDDYTYTAKDGVEIEASTNGTTYKTFESLAFSDSDSEFTLTYGDTSTSTLVNGNTFYFKQVNRNYYAGNEEEQNVTPFKQDTLTFDNEPTNGSANPVKSGGIYSALQGKANSADLGTAATKDVATSGDASASQVVMGNDSRLTDARNAADVSAWAKAATKPTYTASEVGLGNVGNFKAVSTVASQGLTDTEKANARTNIGAGTEIIKRTVTANAGATSVTFTNIPTTSDYLLTLFSTSKTLEYDEVTSVSNSVTYTFDSLETSVDFTLKIEEV